MIRITNEVASASLVGLMLAFAGGMILTGCSSTEDDPPPAEEESRCMEGDANYPDCLEMNM
jgi:hypothetical protein